MGTLESAVLECLWAAEGPLTPRQVLVQVDPALAYTTVVTILTRLTEKELVDRERSGKVFLYRPRVTEADLVAGRMAAALASAGDRVATLSRFAAGLSKREARALRDVLAEADKGGQR